MNHLTRWRDGMLGLVMALGAGSTLANGQPLPFATARVDLREVSHESVFDASIEAVSKTTVSAETSGRVTEVNVDVDDFVPKGAVLLRIKDTEHKARLDQAEGSHRAAVARFKEAKKHYERVAELHRAHSASQAELDTARADLNAARAKLNTAEASVRQARERLGYTVLRAPYAGVVVERHVEPGESVHPGQPLMTGLSLEHLRAVAEVPQALVGPVRRNGHARVMLDGGEPRVIEVERLTFTPYADPRTHTIRVRLELPAGDLHVYPGSFVKAAFTTGQERRLLAPSRAVAYRSEVRGVYLVMPDGRVHFQQVRLGQVRGDEIEVLSGLEPGDVVALDPVRAAVYLKRRRTEGT